MHLYVAPFLFQVIRPVNCSVKANYDLPPPEFLEEVQDWADLYHLSLRLGVSKALLRQVLGASWVLKMPAIVRMQWEERFHFEKMRSAFLESDLKHLSTQFQQNQVEFAILGDVDLAYRYYVESFDRLIEQIEFAVTEVSLPKAAEVLGALGYRSLDGSSYHKPRVRDDFSFSIQLRWSSQLSFAEEDAFEEIWSQMQPNHFSKSPLFLEYSTLSMHPEDALINILMNLYSEMQLNRPIWMNDLNAVLSHFDLQSQLNWDRLMWKLSQKQALSLAWFALCFVKNEWGAPVHDDILRLMGTKITGFKKKLLSRWMTSQNWFGKQGNQIPWMIRSGWLLRDHRFW